VASVVSHDDTLGEIDVELPLLELAPDPIESREEPAAPPPVMRQPPPSAREPAPAAPPAATGSLPAGDNWVETVPEPVTPTEPAPSPAPPVLGESDRDEILDQLMREIVKETASAPRSTAGWRRGLFLLLVGLAIVAVVLLALWLGLI